MTSPLSPEAVAQMVADREAGTPGPWHFDGPVWNQIIWTDGENRLCFMAHSNGLNDDRDIANARRIASLPDIEAAYLTLAAENATLRASEAAALGRVKVLEDASAHVLHDIDDLVANSEGVTGLHRNGDVAEWSDILEGGSFEAWLRSVETLRAALTPTAHKEPKT